MSTHDAERMITVAELLRREGVAAGDGAGKGMKAAVATGVAALCGATVTGMLALAPTLSTSFFPSDPDGASMSSGGGGQADAGSSEGDDRPRPVANRTERQQAAGQLVSASADAPKALTRQATQTSTRIPAMTQIAPDPVRADAQRSSDGSDSSQAGSGSSSAERKQTESRPETTARPAETTESEPRPAEQDSGGQDSAGQDSGEQDSGEQDESTAAEPTASESAEQEDEKGHPRGKSAERGRPDSPGERGRRP